jgi:hypothetical protein
MDMCQNYLIVQCVFLKERYKGIKDYRFIEREKTNFMRREIKERDLMGGGHGRTRGFPVSGAVEQSSRSQIRKTCGVEPAGFVEKRLEAVEKNQN